MGRMIEPTAFAAELPPMAPDRYDRFRPVGEGGMGIVYWAVDNTLNREVAFKVLKPRRSDDGDATPGEPLAITPPERDAPESATFDGLKNRFLQAPRTLATRPEATWVGPVADHQVGLDAATGDPAQHAERRESIRLAFVTALQALPPRQRVVLILRVVLAFSAVETADLLGDSVSSVNSAVVRARATLASRDRGESAPLPTHDESGRLLGDYVAAFEAYDVDRLVSLLAEDARFSMPPYELWLQGAGTIRQWWQGPGQVCRDARTMTTRANGQPAVGIYHPVAAGRWEPFALHVLDGDAGRITAITHFMGAQVFAEFGLPEVITESG